MEQKEPQSGDEQVNDSPIEQVRLTVPITDDPTLPALTFRTWVIGPILCALLSYLQQYTKYRQIRVPIDGLAVTMILVPMAKLMAATLPTKAIRIPGTNRTFSLNPGPFNVKEHVVLDTLASAGLGGAYSLNVISVSKVFYHKNISFWAAFMLVQTTQMLGYGFAGIFIKFFVESPHMWWPAILPNVAFYRMLHEVEVRPKGRVTRTQFFYIVTASSFAYAIVPTYFFQSIMALSFVCLIWKDSVTAHQIGSGLNGFGIGSFPLDWNSMSILGGNPLVTPMFAIGNTMIGFILITYIISPIIYFTNSLDARRFPLRSYDMFDAHGQPYNITRIINDDLSLNQKEYESYSTIYMSPFYILATGFVFAAQAATLTYFFLDYAKSTWQQFTHGLSYSENKFNDVHNRLMKKYEKIPQWWFYTIIIITFALALLTSKFFGKQFQLPYWVVFFGYLLPFVLILPAGVILATTGQGTIDVYDASQLIMGWICPGKPLGNMVFQSYAEGTMNGALAFLGDFKLGHYMKIPPKSMFIAQITGTFICSFVNLVTQWWIFSTVKNICDVKHLAEGSPWTCPGEHQDFTNSMIWGGLGPRRLFAPNSQYSKFYMFLVIGIVATLLVWILRKLFPDNKYIRFIHVPLILTSGTNQPPAGPVNYWSMFTVAIIFNFIVYREYKEWWSRYNYLLSSALNMGIGLVNFLLSMSLQNKGIYGLQWWGLEYGDHCPLANCPTAPGIKVDGCPVF